MYSVMLATMLTVGGATPDWGCRGCCGGCCGGCWGNAFSCYGCCGGCWGCYGCCGGCWGCYGCCGGCWGGCYGCWGGCYGASCYGCCGGCYGCWGGCYGCCGGCYGCYGCYGGWGGVVVAAAPAVGVPVVPVAPGTQSLPPPQKKDEKKSSLGNSAEVLLKAPLNVQLSLDGNVIPRTAAEQAFRTPALESGYGYTYTFKASVAREGRTVSYIKQVQVRAGEVSEADFTKLTTQGKDAAKVTVKLPSDARLYVDGVQCPLTSATRSFDTPDLDAGQRYYYTLKAEVVRDGVMSTKERRVTVEAGKQVTIEFNDLPVQTASR